MQTRKWRASWGVALIVLLAVPAGAKALEDQNGAAAPGPSVLAADHSWPDVNLNIVALDKGGTPQQVDEREFQLFEDGAQRPVQFRGSMDSPVSLAVLIDSSGSIYKRKAEILAAVTTIFKALPADSEVMAVLFADRSFLDLPFTPVSKVDFSFLDRLDGRGGTALYDTVVATENHFVAHARYVRRAMVILSDGEDNASHVSRAQVFRTMEQPGAPAFYACPLSKAGILQSDAMAGLINMKFLAKDGGGGYFNLDPDPAISAARVAAAIRSQYVLHFTAANPARDGKRHKLTVHLPDKSVEIHVLPVYYAPGK